MNDTFNKLNIAIVGKYPRFLNIHFLIRKALKKAARFLHIPIKIHWFNAQRVNPLDIKNKLAGMDAILIPGGFNSNGTETMIEAIKYARENKIPFLGICLGMQLTVIEYARNMASIKDATSAEFDQNSPSKVVDAISSTINTIKTRKGINAVALKENSVIASCYQSLTINEPFRHSYTFNSAYRSLLEEKGLIISGESINEKLIDAIEIANHPFFVAVQFHPEMLHIKEAHPLFISFIKAAHQKH